VRVVRLVRRQERARRLDRAVSAPDERRGDRLGKAELGRQAF
jgi:hypothetical protein